MHRNEETLEQKSFAQLRPLKISSELLAIFACVLVVTLVHSTQTLSPWLYGYCALATLACLLTWRGRTTRHLWLSGLLHLCSCTACLGSVAVAIGNPAFWFLPIGLVLSLPGSAMHSHPLHAFSTGAGIWVTLFSVTRPDFGQDLNVLLVLIIGSLLIATLVCSTFCRTRKDVFDLQQQLHGMAYKDTLTGLPNRRAFMDRLTITLADKSTSQPLFFLMLDIDDFKKVNDSFGHDVGDQVLVEVAQLLRQHSQGHNHARMGGEEFAVAARLADIAKAQTLAQAMIDAVHASQAGGLRLSISIGLAQHKPDESLHSLMRRADMALYDAKNSGKGCYALAGQVVLVV